MKRLLLLFTFLLIIPLALADDCGNGYCDNNETVDTCCVDCGCENNETCWGVPGAADDQKSCADPFCGDLYCDEDLDENSIPDEYWKNCCDDCGCHGSDRWEAEKMIDFDIPFYVPTDDACYNNRCDGCHVDSQCDDKDNCTVDQCLDYTYLNKSICIIVPITNCSSGDGCCPAGCDYGIDTDCKGRCGDRKCEDPENCENCAFDCGCDLGFDCIEKECVLGESYCEMRGNVEDGLFCSGKKWVTQFGLGADCEENYECVSGLCNDVCIERVISEEQKAFFIKIGILAVVLAGAVVYMLFILQKYRSI